MKTHSSHIIALNKTILAKKSDFLQKKMLKLAKLRKPWY